MSFSVGATGTRQQVISSLQHQSVAGRLGARVLAMLIEVMRDAPSLSGDRTLVYSVSASGHEDLDGYSSPYVSVSLGATVQPDPATDATPAPAPASA